MSEVSTGCTPLDELLGGGVEAGAITQVYGPPAAGKTNVALSAAVEVAAAGDRALYIDTEGLSVDRFGQLATGRGEDLPDRIIVSDAHDFEEQREAVADAAEFADQVELIVLDSATGFYRLEREADGDGEALRAVARQLTSLLALARKHDLAVVVTNQVYTDPESDTTRPLGGHTLSHWTGVVVRLERFRGGNRRATLVKHHAKETGDTVQFTITESGIEAPADGVTQGRSSP